MKTLQQSIEILEGYLHYTANEAIFPNPRIEVSTVGFMATWWMGLPIDLILGLVGLIHKVHKQMLRVTMKAIIITIIVTFITGLA